MRQRYPEAIELIKKALNVNPDDLALSELGGRLMAMGGQLQEAKEVTQKALDKTTEQDQELATKVWKNKANKCLLVNLTTYKFMEGFFFFFF